jgi:hypothetical protein
MGEDAVLAVPCQFDFVFQFLLYLKLITKLIMVLYSIILMLICFIWLVYASYTLL